jgi:hypothetical protein
MHRKRLADPNARCPRHNKKDWRPLVEKAWDAGWWITKARNNYLHCYPPDDSKMIRIPSTPSSRYTLRTKAGQLKKAGVDL